MNSRVTHCPLRSTERALFVALQKYSPSSCRLLNQMRRQTVVNHVTLNTHGLTQNKSQNRLFLFSRNIQKHARISDCHRTWISIASNSDIWRWMSSSLKIRSLSMWLATIWWITRHSSSAREFTSKLLFSKEVISGRTQTSKLTDFREIPAKSEK